MDETWLTHVDHFSDYVRDLEAFMDRVVLPRAKNLPLCLYAHSMGGAVGSMMLQRHPKMFARAVLTAPMIAPSSAPFPSWAGAAIARFMCAIGKTREMAFIGKPFDPKAKRSRPPSARVARGLIITSASGLKTGICKTARRPTAGSGRRSA